MREDQRAGKKLLAWIALEDGCLLCAQRTRRHPHMLLDDNPELPGQRSKFVFGLWGIRPTAKGSNPGAKPFDPGVGFGGHTRFYRMYLAPFDTGNTVSGAKNRRTLLKASSRSGAIRISCNIFLQPSLWFRQVQLQVLSSELVARALTQELARLIWQRSCLYLLNDHGRTRVAKTVQAGSGRDRSEASVQAYRRAH